jgi:hypothetical protein
VTTTPIVSGQTTLCPGAPAISFPIPITARYRKDHTYLYEVTGQGYPLSVKLDDVLLDDNYGQILITISLD